VNDCIRYSGKLTKGGYPCSSHWVWRRIFGHIPDELEVDHLCENPWCVNPKHLELVTHKENVRRTWMRRTHCRNGHPKLIENVYVSPSGNLACLDCIRAQGLRYYAQNKERVKRRQREYDRKAHPSIGTGPLMRLSAERRSQIARIAAEALWAKRRAGE
jgi:HNH endonuclease